MIGLPVDLDNAVTQAFIQHLLTDAALFGAGMVSQPAIGSGYVGVYARSVPAPDPTLNVSRDDLYPAIMVTPQGLLANYAMDGAPSVIGFTGLVQVLVVDQGRLSVQLQDILNEMFAWINKLNVPNNTILDSVIHQSTTSFINTDASSNP